MDNLPHSAETNSPRPSSTRALPRRAPTLPWAPRTPFSWRSRGRRLHTHGGCPRDHLLHFACILLASATIRRVVRPSHRPPNCLRGRRRPAPPLDRDGGAGYVIASPRRQPATPCPPRPCLPR